MQLNRRKFIKLGVAAGAALAASKSGVLSAKGFASGGKSVSQSGKKRTSKPYICMTCNIEDGGIAYMEGGRIVKLEGNPEHPGNRGKLCARGNAGFLHAYDPCRLLYPLKRVGKRGAGKWKRVTWKAALDEVAGKIDAAIQKDPNSFAIQAGRDRTHGAKSRFAKACGTDSVWNHTSVCESSKKVGMEHTWGPDIEVPDFAHSKYILNFGGNVLEASYFHNPYAQRISEGVNNNKAKMVAFDVRLSNTAGFADEWIPIFPGTDGVVALAMCNVIMNEGLSKDSYIDKHCNVSASDLRSHLSKYTPKMAEKESGVPAATIARIAREFATAGPATTYTYRGPCMHVNGTYNERCTMLLNIITGNIEIRGGYNLPRGLGWINGGGPKPTPPGAPKKSILSSMPDYPLANHKVSHLVGQRIAEGVQKLNVYLSYYFDANYAMPDSETWTEILKDENLIPYHVATGPNMSEMDLLADIILPDTSYLERWDPESMPSSYVGWVGIRQPVIKSPGGMSFRDVTIELGKRIPSAKKYYDGLTSEGWMKAHFDEMPGLKEKGGLKYLKKHGIYKQPGISEDTFKFNSDGGGAPLGDKKINIRADGLAKWGYEAMPVYSQIKMHNSIRNSRSLKSTKMVMTTFKWNVHTQSRTANLKWLAEIVHKNPAWINTATAKAKGISEGSLIRITSDIGHIVTKAHVTEGIHPKVIAVSHSCGHRGFGSIATQNKRFNKDNGIEDSWMNPTDPDHKHVWWRDNGVHPNSIVPLITDPIGGSQGWFDTVVKVEKAKGGDKYGDVKVKSFKVRTKAYKKHSLDHRSSKAAHNTKMGGGH